MQPAKEPEASFTFKKEGGDERGSLHKSPEVLNLRNIFGSMSNGDAPPDSPGSARSDTKAKKHSAQFEVQIEEGEKTQRAPTNRVFAAKLAKREEPSAEQESAVFNYQPRDTKK